LQEKENAIQRVAREIKILRLAAPLLSEDVPSGAPTHEVHAMTRQPERIDRGREHHDALINDVLAKTRLP